MDRANLAVNLYVDDGGRLLELEVLRFEDGPVLGSDWATLRLLESHEIVRLGTYSLDANKSGGSRLREWLLHRIRVEPWQD